MNTFTKVIGLHNIFDVTGTTYTVTNIKSGVSEASYDSIVFVKADTDDVGRTASGRSIVAGDGFVWTHGVMFGLFPGVVVTTYRVTYKANATNVSGSIPIDSGAYSSGDTVTVLGNTGSLTRTGYTWNGWQENYGDLSGTSYGPGTGLTATYTIGSSDVNFWARWNPNTYTITLNSVNATTHGTESITATYGANTNLTSAITKPTRTGKTFLGYFTNLLTSGDGDTSSTKVVNSDGNFIASVAGYTGADKSWQKASNTLLYAGWNNATYTITYKDKDGGNYSGSNSSSLPTTHTYGTATTLQNGIKTGYIFGGWYTDSACTGTAITSLEATTSSNTTLYANWTANLYTVSLSDNYGSGGMTSITVTYGSAMPPLTTLPTRSGYTLDGYFTAATSGIKYYNANGTSAKICDITNNSTTLYAQWTKNAVYNYYIWGANSTSLESTIVDGITAQLIISAGMTQYSTVVNPSYVPLAEDTHLYVLAKTGSTITLISEGLADTDCWSSAVTVKTITSADETNYILYRYPNRPATGANYKQLTIS